ncbi:helix-turn-helix domain-containing protein [Streptomyces sp. QH1-20]|uniref:helix-turn-helix domain-containing protein n=1 Tax=Streptomyces sp. QH1-20 TaxID=3240934 RepID=UPI0035141B51
MTDTQQPQEGQLDTERGQPPQAAKALPSNIWARPDVREALAAADFSALCRALRKHSGWRQQDLAALAGVCQAYWSQLERGRRGMPWAKAAGFLRALGAPTSLLPAGPDPRTLAVACHRAQRCPGDTASGSGTSLSALSAASADSSLQFVELITSGAVDSDELEYLSLQLSRLATAYVHAPLLPLFKDLIKVRDRIFDHLRRHQGPAQTRVLYRLAGTACLLLAHASQNIGDEHSALGQLRTARTFAEQADHTGLRAWTRGTYALFAEWSPRRRQALAFAEEAARLAPPGDSRIRIAAIAARTAARLGDRDRALVALTAMRAAQAQTPVEDELSEIGGILTFPRAKQDYYTGTVYSLLGDHSRAEYHATRALQQYAAGPAEERSYGDEALPLTDIITARLAHADFTSAGRLLQQLVDLPPALRIRQLGTGLHRIQSILSQPQLRTTPAARHLAELTHAYKVIESAGPVPSVR